MLSAISNVFLATLCFSGMASADFWRFSIPQWTAVETREWNTDHLKVVISLSAGTQNVHSTWKVVNDTKKGTYISKDLWQDITLTGNENGLIAPFAVYNTGDNEDQDLALKILNMVLAIPSRIPVVGLVATALQEVLDFFKGAYHCEGLVALSAPTFDRNFLQSMPYNSENCWFLTTEYTTGKGCVDINPTTSKQSKYQVKYCISRFSGTSSANGGFVLNGGESARVNRNQVVSAVFAMATVLIAVAYV